MSLWMGCDFTTAVLMPMSCCRSALILTWIRPPTSVTVPLSSTSKGTMSIPIESLPGLSETSLGLMVERYMIFFLGADGSSVLASPTWPRVLPEVPAAGPRPLLPLQAAKRMTASATRQGTAILILAFILPSPINDLCRRILFEPGDRAPQFGELPVIGHLIREMGVVDLIAGQRRFHGQGSLLNNGVFVQLDEALRRPGFEIILGDHEGHVVLRGDEAALRALEADERFLEHLGLLRLAIKRDLEPDHDLVHAGQPALEFPARTDHEVGRELLASERHHLVPFLDHQRRLLDHRGVLGHGLFDILQRHGEAFDSLVLRHPQGLVCREIQEQVDLSLESLDHLGHRRDHLVHPRDLDLGLKDLRLNAVPDGILRLGQLERSLQEGFLFTENGDGLVQGIKLEISDLDVLEDAQNDRVADFLRPFEGLPCDLTLEPELSGKRDGLGK